MYNWKINTGQVYSVDAGAWVTGLDESEITPLYSDTTDRDNLIMADRDFLRATVLFYCYPLGECLKNRLDKIQDIQAAYVPQLTALQEAKAGAEMRDDADDVAEIKAEYLTLLQEMNDQIKAVPHGD